MSGRSDVVRRDRPRLAVWKFASCDGCQLSLLDCEDELLAVAGAFDIAYFAEASRRMLRGPYDLSLVEGSITTSADAERIQRVRRLSRRLVTIGVCATAGGIQALRNFADVREFAAAVYPHPEYLKTVAATSTPISAHVPVDFELRGCPIDKRQLLEVIKAFLAGRKPAISGHSVCHECKSRGTVCVMVAHGPPCLGPVTHSGCGAICPAYSRGCCGDVLALIELWEGFQSVIVVDAAALMIRPGRIHRLDLARNPLPAVLASPSTHAFGLAETVELARSLGRLPRFLVAYLVESERFETGALLSPAVMRVVDDVAERILIDIAGSRGSPFARCLLTY
jgi:sulfhydrogenase subunit delta